MFPLKVSKTHIKQVCDRYYDFITTKNMVHFCVCNSTIGSIETSENWQYTNRISRFIHV